MMLNVSLRSFKTIINAENLVSSVYAMHSALCLSHGLTNFHLNYELYMNIDVFCIMQRCHCVTVSLVAVSQLSFMFWNHIVTKNVKIVFLTKPVVVL